MKLSDFDYYLPKELIAQEPLSKRDASRLLVVDRRANTISHRRFRDLFEYLKPLELLVLNNTRVIPARLLGVKKDTGGKVDVLLVERLSRKRFKALIRPHLKIDQEIILNRGTVRARLAGDKVLEFRKDLSLEFLKKIGLMPLPPYIKRHPQKLDALRYQTVYASKPGAIACPTAGLHFTDGLLKEIKEKKVNIAYITLHVGAGTFQPVKRENIKEHIMEPEEFNISRKAREAVIKTKEKSGRIFAVGTTTARALEASSELISNQAVRSGHTGLFIYPGYKFKVVDCLLTNFHLPKTTLLMLACAFAGKDLIMQAYQQAIREKYRFYSYGDAMLII